MHLSERDRALVWHPFTQEKTAMSPLAIQRGEGSYVYDETGKRYLDLISSWWVNLHGHAHPVIARAIYDQACTLEHILFAGFTHEPAVKLCEQLQSILADTLTRFFFSDNGSTCVEVALKMASQYWYNREKAPRPLFISFDGGYHGDTFGAMSVGAKSGYHDPFKALFFKVLSVPFPETWEGDTDIEAKEQHALTCLEQHLHAHPQQIAAIILEPLIQGASGMRMCRPAFVKTVVERVRQAGILVIFDEVMTGFGRTGTSFAYEQIGIAPDFLCISKGITGGFLPLALTITTNEIYQAFLSDHWQHAFAHGHSYTANPIACAAAVASFEMLMREETQEAIKAIQGAHREGLAYLKKTCIGVEKIRLRGTVAAFDINNRDMATLKQTFLQEGLLIRPIGNSVYLLPPYSTTPEELRDAYRLISSVLLEAADISSSETYRPAACPRDPDVLLKDKYECAEMEGNGSRTGRRKLHEGRSKEKELMDLGPAFYTQEEYAACLKILFKVNRLLGFFNSTVKLLKQFPADASLVDVGCGGGLFLLNLSQHYPDMKLLGIDVSETAIEQAKNELMQWRVSAGVSCTIETRFPREGSNAGQRTAIDARLPREGGDPSLIMDSGNAGHGFPPSRERHDGPCTAIEARYPREGGNNGHGFPPSQERHDAHKGNDMSGARPVNVEFQLQNQLALDLEKNSVDIVLVTLVCHHIDDEDLTEFLQNAWQAARHAVIINDLHRHPLAYWFYKKISPILFRNRLITHDGLVSIQRSFTRAELQSLLKRANISHYEIKWGFPFRWRVILWKK